MLYRHLPAPEGWRGWWLSSHKAIAGGRRKKILIPLATSISSMVLG